MKVNKFMSAVLLLVAFMNFVRIDTYAQTDADYDSMLRDLETMMAECTEKGYSTDYEMINYNVIKNFKKYMQEDIENNIDADIIEYNQNCIQELYSEAKENLASYLNGEKLPVKVRKTNVSEMHTNGINIEDSNGPFFSVGYGHGTQIINDIDKLSDFGTDNIQIEVGLTNFQKYPYGWIFTGSYDLDYEVDVSEQKKYGGKYSFKLINNTEAAANSGSCVRFRQIVPAKPNTVYKYGCYSLGTKVSRLTISADNWNDRKYIGPSNIWKKNDYTFKTADNQTEMVFNIVCEGITGIFLDDCYLYETDSAGNICSENLLENPGFENNSAYTGSIKYVTDTLEKAEKNNMCVSLLLSPHYFPSRVDGVTYTDTEQWIKYNIEEPKSREMIEDYLRELLPLLKDYPALQNICLSNEPSYNTTRFYEFYNPRFREYLQTVHKDITSLNKAYNTSYKSFDDVNMPTDLKAHDAICYDWIEFNDKVFADWHKWIANIVREYFPDKPLHSKVSPYFSVWTEDDERIFLSRGTDLEMFDEFSDYAGNDSWNYENDNNSTYRQQMFYYDYLKSVTGKPVYNSEDHPIDEKYTLYSSATRKHIRNHLWQGAVHGRNMSTIWEWERKDYQGERLDSVLDRPDVTAEIGKTYLDMNRLSDKLAEISNEKPRIALMYSKPSRVYDANYSKNLFITYSALNEIGETVGIVSDKSINMLTDYNVLIIPGAENCKKETLNCVERFIKNGGQVIYCGDAFSRDEYNNSIDNSYLCANSHLYTASNTTTAKNTLLKNLHRFGMARMTIQNEVSDGEVSGIDWKYKVEDDRILINITNLSTEKISGLSFYLDGEKLDGTFHELITDSNITETINLDVKTPMLLEYFIEPTAGICNLSYDKNEGKISWLCTSQNYDAVRVYRLNENGTLTFNAETQVNNYKLLSDGTYILRAVKANKEGTSAIITCEASQPFDISIYGVKYTNGRFSGEFVSTNKLNHYASGIMNIELHYEGEWQETYQNSFTIPANRQDTLRLSIPTEKKPDYIMLNIWSDLYSKTPYADCIKIEIE